MAISVAHVRIYIIQNCKNILSYQNVENTSGGFVPLNKTEIQLCKFNFGKKILFNENVRRADLPIYNKNIYQKSLWDKRLKTMTIRSFQYAD